MCTDRRVKLIISEMPHEMNASFVPGAESQKHTTPPTAVSSTLITRPWPIRLERISCAVSHVGHNSESILGMNDYVVNFFVLSRLIRLNCIEKHLSVSAVLSGWRNANVLTGSKTCLLFVREATSWICINEQQKQGTNTFCKFILPAVVVTYLACSFGHWKFSAVDGKQVRGYSSSWLHLALANEYNFA